MGRVRISESLRVADVPPSERVLGCVGDRNVRVVEIELPRYCDGTDMDGMRVQVMYANADGTGDYSELTEVEAGETSIVGRWQVPRLAFAAAGAVVAGVRLTGDGREFNSERFGFVVRPSAFYEPHGDELIDGDGNVVVVRDMEDTDGD